MEIVIDWRVEEFATEVIVEVGWLDVILIGYAEVFIEYSAGTEIIIVLALLLLLYTLF